MICDGVIFDLDGTLWDSSESLTDVWRLALAGEPDIPRPPTTEELQSVMGMTAPQLMKTLFPQLTPERGAELFAQLCVAEDAYLREHGGRLYPGLTETLEQLARQCPLAIVSNCGPEYIPAFFAAHKLEPYFAGWECIGRTGKEKWENIRLVAQRLGMTQPVYVGDTAMDQAAAQKAGVPFIHAAYGFGRAEGAPHIDAPGDLPGLLQFLT